MVAHSPFFGFKFRRRVPRNQKEGPHWVHVTQGCRNKGDYELNPPSPAES